MKSIVGGFSFPLQFTFSIIVLFPLIDIGEVWANMLFNVYAALVGTYGFSTSARTNPSGTEGNIVFLHLFIDSLALQPCNPTCKFDRGYITTKMLTGISIVVTARNAWIQADVNRYGGANKCLLWKGFASRVLGVNAASYTDDTTVPSDC